MCNAQLLPNLYQPSSLPAHVHADPAVAGRRLSMPNLYQPSSLPAHVHADPVVVGRMVSICTMLWQVALAYSNMAFANGIAQCPGWEMAGK